MSPSLINLQNGEAITSAPSSIYMRHNLDIYVTLIIQNFTLSELHISCVASNIRNSSRIDTVIYGEQHYYTSLFQLRLTGLNNCLQWVVSIMAIAIATYFSAHCIAIDYNFLLTTDWKHWSKLEDIALAVLENTQELCQCGFVRDRISGEVFRCFPSSPQAVTYRAVLHGTASATSSQLISHIKQWTAEAGAAITVQRIICDYLKWMGPARWPCPLSLMRNAS